MRTLFGFDSMTIRAHDTVPAGRIVLMRQGQVVWIGPLAHLEDHYHTNDVVMLSPQDFKRIETEKTP